MVVIAAVVVVLIVSLGGSKKSGLSGAFKCTVPGQSGTGTITFNSGNKYTLSSGGTGGSYTRSGNTITFTSGDLKEQHGELQRQQHRADQG